MGGDGNYFTRCAIRSITFGREELVLKLKFSIHSGLSKIDARCPACITLALKLV